MNSDDEDSKQEEHGDKLTGMYANGCSSLEQARMSEQQAQAQGAAASATFSGSLAPLISNSEPKASPMNSDDDESWMNPDQKRLAQVAREVAAAEEAARQEAARQEAARKLAHLSAPPRPATRIPLPSDSDPEIQAPAKAAPLEITKATLVPAVDISKSVMKAAASL
jgi:hypothetical protein